MSRKANVRALAVYHKSNIEKAEREIRKLQRQIKDEKAKLTAFTLELAEIEATESDDEK